MTRKHIENTSIRQKKITENMNLIPYTLHRLKMRLPVGMSREDAMQYGYIGLIEAIDSYEEDKGSFSTFALRRIHGAMLDGIFAYHWLSRNQMRNCRKWMSAKKELEEKYGSDVSEEEIAAHLRVRPKQGEEWHRLVNTSILYSDALEDSEEAFLHEAVVSDISFVEETLEHDSLWQAINGLDDLEGRLIKAYYFENKPIKEFADENGLSQNWACALHRRALKRLKKQLKV